MKKTTLIILTLLLQPVAMGISLAATREATGVIEASRKVDLAVKIMGRATIIHAEEGSHIKKDTVLLQLDDTELRADLASAQAGLKLAKLERAHFHKTVNRVNKLTLTNALAEERKDDAQYNHAAASERVNQSQAIIAKTRARLRETRLHAPFAGVITRKDIELGQITQPGMTVFTLEDHSSLKIRAQVKEHEIPHIIIGQPVRVTIDALDGLALPGKVSRIIPSGNAETHAFTVDIAVPAHDSVLPGMFAKLSFTEKEGE